MKVIAVFLIEKDTHIRTPRTKEYNKFLFLSLFLTILTKKSIIRTEKLKKGTSVSILKECIGIRGTVIVKKAAKYPHFSLYISLPRKYIP